MRVIMKLKICGVTEKEMVHKLDKMGVDYVGLWFNVQRGEYELDIDLFKNISSTKTKNLKLIGVTLDNDYKRIIKYVKYTNIQGIQLHGFQLPGVINKLKKSVSEKIKIIKVLHIKNERCMEYQYIDRYISAGVDLFILDTYISKNKIGSTGIKYSLEKIDSLITNIGESNIILAGGIDSELIKKLYVYQNLHGVDIDTAARSNGRISASKVRKLVKSVNINNLQSNDTYYC
jgi:phosphoribosylanthranilate isomerase